MGVINKMEISKEEIRENIYAVKLNVHEQGTIIGWALIYVIANERHDEPYAFLENVYIEQEYRKKGLGTDLLNEVIEEAKRRNCYKIIGTSRFPKEYVHDFYLKHGFTKWGYEFRMDLKDSEIKQRD